jgi:hypothetical protein
MSHDYTEAVRRNLLSRSATQRLPQAFAEWQFTGETRDYRTATEVCQLCEQENLRYHFLIASNRTKARLWVGSSCILRFGVGVFEEGERLSPKRAQRKLNALVEEMRHESCLSALEEVATAEENPILLNALRYYRDYGYLTPRFGAVVLWRLSEHKIDHNPSFFKISLKRQKYRDDLAQMSRIQVRTIWAALSPSQRRIAEAVGHSSPE